MNCIRCGKSLKPEHVERGYDDECRDILNETAKRVALEYSESQVRKAATVLRSGAFSFMGNGFARCISSDGNTVYWITRDSCTCPAGEQHIKCYHRCAFDIRCLSPVI